MVSLLIEFNFNFCHLKKIKGSEISDFVYVLTTQDVKKKLLLWLHHSINRYKI